MTLLRLLVFTVTAIVPIAALADPIEGEWTTMDTSIATINECEEHFCIVMKTGDWPGKEIGRLKRAGKGKYSGSVTDPRDGRTYAGRASLVGDSLKLSGCALKIFCQTESWTRR